MDVSLALSGQVLLLGNKTLSQIYTFWKTYGKDGKQNENQGYGYQ